MGCSRKIDPDWLREHYPRMTDINRLLDDFEAEFGWRPRKTSAYMCANRLGLRKEPVGGRADRAERTIRWTKEPEMERWMLENDHGQRMDELQAAWRERWGFNISRGQVNIFRGAHGTQTRKDHGGGRHRVPMYSERASKDGYLVIKARENPSRPMSKDNWVLKHVWVYEQTHGKVPEGHVVYFADGDKRNFDPDNLVAVPRRLVGVLNNASMPKWHDAASLRACMSLAELVIARKDVLFSAPRVCSACGRKFVPSERQRAAMRPPSLCPECVKAGRRRHRIDWDEVVRLHESGMNYAQIARRVGCSGHHVSSIVRKSKQGAKS